MLKKQFNKRTFNVGPTFSGRTYRLLKTPSGVSDRVIYKTTKSPLEQNSDSKIKIREIGKESKPLSEDEVGIIVFDDILDSSKKNM